MDTEAAAAMGFMPDVAERSIKVIEAMALPPETLNVAMDLARYVRFPLDEATWALVQGPKRLRRLGIEVPPEADPLEYTASQVAGMAKAYTTTIYGSLDVREAQGNTISPAITGLLERTFGPR